MVINRLQPAELKDEHFRVWKELQERYVTVIEESFAPLPVFRVPLFDRGMVGPDALRELARACFGAEDPARLFYRGLTQTIEKDQDGYLVSLRLPFVDKKDVSLTQKGDELYVQAGDCKRNMLLPRTLAGKEVKNAVLEGGVLKIWFRGEADDR
ncbi:hypothetical protein Daudx_1844 [Candidatus Desulforudis audaxviator]|nr:hypothetical protein Daudx_1844 [Candidatus Desulforudis audaxviator]